MFWCWLSFSGLNIKYSCDLVYLIRNFVCLYFRLKERVFWITVPTRSSLPFKRTSVTTSLNIWRWATTTTTAWGFSTRTSTSRIRSTLSHIQSSTATRDMEFHSGDKLHHFFINLFSLERWWFLNWKSILPNSICWLGLRWVICGSPGLSQILTASDYCC